MSDLFQKVSDYSFGRLISPWPVPVIEVDAAQACHRRPAYGLPLA